MHFLTRGDALHRFGRCALVLLFFWLDVPAHGAMEIEGIQNGTAPASNYDRFDNSSSWIGNPANWPGGAPPNSNPNPWAGVGRDSSLDRWATLISPSFIISANHYCPSVGDTIQFDYTNNPNGPIETRTVTASEWLQVAVPGDTGDVWIGKLNSPITDLPSYPILNLPTQAGDNTPYGGLGISTFGLSTSAPGTATSVRLGRNVINSNSAVYASFDPTFTNVSNAYIYSFDYDSPGVGPDESQVMVGDSGAPSFFLYAGGSPALLGLHWYNTANVISGDTWLTKYVGDIQTGMNQLGNPNNDTVKTVSPLRGDFNLDGKVDDSDILAMEKALANLSQYESQHGMNAAYLDDIGDINGDGKVNNADLRALINMLHNHTESAQSALVPEPASWLLSVLSLLALCLIGRQGRIRLPTFRTS
jgi:Dockerin type I domain